MQHQLSYKNAFVSLLAIFFIIQGIWGLFSNVVFGILSTNKLHAVIHIALSFWGFYCVIQSSIRLYCLFVGPLVILVGVLRYVPATADVIVELLNVNPEVAYLNMFIGFFYLLIGIDKSTAREKV